MNLRNLRPLASEMRGSALWGTKGGGVRVGNERGRKLTAILATAIACLALPATALAADGATIPDELRDAARSNPSTYFDVIIQGDASTKTTKVADAVAAAASEEAEDAVEGAEDGRADARRKLAEAERRVAAAKAALTKAKRSRKSTAAAAVAAAEALLAAARSALPELETDVEAAEGSVEAAREQRSAARDRAYRDDIRKRFIAVNGVAARVRGKDILRLAKRKEILSITRNAPVTPVPSGSSPVVNPQDGSMWRDSTNLDIVFSGLGSLIPQAPAIAIVDSGVDSSRVETFGTRVVASVNVSSSGSGKSKDDQGHGTMVAALAAGASPLFPGAAPNARIVDVRTADKDGKSLTSDVIAGIDWILANKDRYDIRVANFSLAGTSEASVLYDPLDRAVERLWFSGIVVVTAVGNHGSADGPVKIPSPANDPFVITVGALDQLGTANPADDLRAPWSAYGYTADGFAKPELSAPGRYLTVSVPLDCELVKLRPDRIRGAGHMWMSGTSLAAPIVSGAAAQILAVHPDWSPDDVKGALMLTAAAVPGASGFAAGVGEIDAAAAVRVSSPPNPNAALNTFLGPDPEGGSLPVFDTASWSSAAHSSASWSSASWSSASWSSASWSSASWSSASWSSASWSSASWSSASWSSASWSSGRADE